MINQILPTKDQYKILNISKSSSTTLTNTQITKAYRKQAVTTHPDKNNGNTEAFFVGGFVLYTHSAFRHNDYEQSCGLGQGGIWRCPTTPITSIGAGDTGDLNTLLSTSTKASSSSYYCLVVVLRVMLLVLNSVRSLVITFIDKYE
jgi:hypothetical protein